MADTVSQSDWKLFRKFQLARAFDAPRRSTMIQQLFLISRHQLLEPRELGQFSAEARDVLERLHEAANV